MTGRRVLGRGVRLHLVNNSSVETRTHPVLEGLETSGTGPPGPVGRAVFTARISIVTAVCNGLPLIERAFRSIVQQTFTDWEWLAVDDGSTDGTGDLFRSWASEDSRIRPLFHEENQGPAAARNTALRAAQGEFIVYLDHDDEYYPDYLANVVQMCDKGDVLVFGYDMVKDDDPP
jgi:glycosyltransferase involved in cell wall biosynthesis